MEFEKIVDKPVLWSETIRRIYENFKTSYFGLFDIGNWYGGWMWHPSVDDSSSPIRMYNDAVLDEHIFQLPQPLLISNTTTSTTSTNVLTVECYTKLEGSKINAVRIIELVLFPFACTNSNGETAVLDKIEYTVYNDDDGSQIYQETLSIGYQTTIYKIPDIVPIYRRIVFKKPILSRMVRNFKTVINLYAYSVGGGEIEAGFFRFVGGFIGVRIRGVRT